MRMNRDLREVARRVRERLRVAKSARGPESCERAARVQSLPPRSEISCEKARVAELIQITGELFANHGFINRIVRL
jgi:hypothetical protein